MGNPLPDTGHDPVLLHRCLEWLRPADGRVIVDCTVGRGGHSRAICELLLPDGLLVGLDFDPRNLEFAKSRLTGLPAKLFHANFGEVADALSEAGAPKVDGILADLGISTNQLFDTAYGLSFDRDAPLDMRLDPRTRLTAKQIINNWSEQKIADTLYQLADERFFPPHRQKHCREPPPLADQFNRAVGRSGAGLGAQA